MDRARGYLENEKMGNYIVYGDNPFDRNSAGKIQCIMDFIFNDSSCDSDWIAVVEL